MKIANCLGCLCALLIVAAPSPAPAQNAHGDAPLMVSRDADGSINEESRVAIRQLTRMAQRNGHVRLWVTLDLHFDPFLVDVSEQAAADQQQRLDDVFDLVLNPLLSSGQIQYVDGARVYNGPSLKLMATKRGLQRLVEDRRVGQVVGVRESQPR